jgi:hypothetical protein
VIQIKAKTKISKPKAKKARETSSRVPRRPEGYFKDALTPEDIAEINMFGAAIAKANWEASKDRWDQIVAEYTNTKTKAKRRP